MAADIPTTEPPVTPPEPVETDSLAEHQAEYGPQAKRPLTPPPAEPIEPSTGASTGASTNGAGRHRAQSHRASPQDVDTIAEYTKRLRDAEREAGITAPEKKPGESERAYAIRRQAELVEAVRDAKRAAAQPPSRAPAPQPRAESPQPRQAPEFAPYPEPLPNPQDFEKLENPALAYYQAIAGHEFNKRIWDAQQQFQAQQVQEYQQRALEEGRKQEASLNAKIASYQQVKPDYWQKMEEVEDIKVPDIALHAISTDDKAPEIAYHLATHPDDLVDLVGFSMSLDLSHESVALVRRRLTRYLSQVPGVPTAASAPAKPVVVAPRPPTAVRTGPLKTGDDELPDDDDHSLANHEKYFGPGAKRRR